MRTGNTTAAETRSLCALLNEFVEVEALSGELTAFEQLAAALAWDDPLAVELADARHRLQRLHARVLEQIHALLVTETETVH